jgi:hypothetical protein
MKHVVVAFSGLVSSLFFACSATVPGDPGVPPPPNTTACSASQQNGYGVCYPTTEIGTSVHTGSVSGSRINNFAFTGFETNTDSSGTPINTGTATTKTIHLGDFFDPQQKGVPGIIGGVPIKIIHLTVAALWCGPCNDETDFVAGANYTGTNTSGASWAKELAPLGVVFVQAIDDGQTVGTGATLTDLNTWIGRHNNDFTTMVDPGNANLGVFFDAAAIPFNMNIDARSMEILSADVGFDENMDNTIKTQYLTWVQNNPALQ